ncbi:MAG: T9SS type A sorting domain-containing protein [Bacteroidales bacterium]|nr:T9SS type A sorting domain-containing protein [Bacteroidales bacterium]
MKNILAATVSIIFLINTATGQIQQRPSILVSNENNELLQFPWAGGMNAVQFGELDINRDGTKDLLAFDRRGNRKMCFINQGTANTIDYELNQSYAELIPELSDWAIFVDYDGDGKSDIFTYSPGWAGMKVYKNISTNLLKFELVVYPYLSSFQGGGYVNLLVTNVDYPGIADIDNDGDLDILTFWGLGSFVEMHKNLSMEKYGHADSLDFEKTEYCWGNFAESEESNTIYLDSCFFNDNMESRKDRHTGSTFLLMDLDADNDKDLLLGDVDYPGLIALTNGGTPEDALITSYDTTFPANSETIELFSMPVSAYIDVNNDGIKDLLVSPFDPGITTSQNKNSIWLYLNSGTNNQPVFELYTKSFLQEEMMDFGSGAYPVLCDWDGDGLTDLLVGNYGYYSYSYYDESYFLHSVYRGRLAFYKNTGTAQQAEFQLWDNNLGNLWQENIVGIYPAFGDLDGDGNTDLLVGHSSGELVFLKNTGNNGFEIIDRNFFNIDVGDFSTPQLFDLNKDGLLDLIIGEKKGNLNYYQNTGTSSNPEFQLTTDSLGKINVTDFTLSYDGYSTPWFFREADGVSKLVVGSEKGKIFYFTHIDGNLQGTFTESDELDVLLDTTDVSFDRGMRTAACLADIDQDGILEMIAGNYSGGLEYFGGATEVSTGLLEAVSNSRKELLITPNPASHQITIHFPKASSEYQVQIYSLNGKVESTLTAKSFSSKRISLDINNLKSGIYFVQAVNQDTVFSGKFVVIR